MTAMAYGQGSFSFTEGDPLRSLGGIPSSLTEALTGKVLEDDPGNLEEVALIQPTFLKTRVWRELLKPVFIKDFERLTHREYQAGIHAGSHHVRQGVDQDQLAELVQQLLTVGSETTVRDLRSAKEVFLALRGLQFAFYEALQRHWYGHALSRAFMAALFVVGEREQERMAALSRFIQAKFLQEFFTALITNLRSYRGKWLEELTSLPAEAWPTLVGELLATLSRDAAGYLFDLLEAVPVAVVPGLLDWLTSEAVRVGESSDHTAGGAFRATFKSTFKVSSRSKPPILATASIRNLFERLLELLPWDSSEAAERLRVDRILNRLVFISNGNTLTDLVVLCTWLHPTAVARLTAAVSNIHGLEIAAAADQLATTVVYCEADQGALGWAADRAATMLLHNLTGPRAGVASAADRAGAYLVTYPVDAEADWADVRLAVNPPSHPWLDRLADPTDLAVLVEFAQGLVREIDAFALRGLRRTDPKRFALPPVGPFAACHPLLEWVTPRPAEPDTDALFQLTTVLTTGAALTEPLSRRVTDWLRADQPLTALLRLLELALVHDDLVPKQRIVDAAELAEHYRARGLPVPADLADGTRLQGPIVRPTQRVLIVGTGRVARKRCSVVYHPESGQPLTTNTGYWKRWRIAGSTTTMRPEQFAVWQEAHARGDAFDMPAAVRAACPNGDTSQPPVNWIWVSESEPFHRPQLRASGWHVVRVAGSSTVEQLVKLLD